MATLGDRDAEDERFGPLVFTVTNRGGLFSAPTGEDLIPQAPVGTATPNQLIIDDAQDQNYKLTLAPNSTPMEGAGDVTVNVSADPAHFNRTQQLRLFIDPPAATSTFTLSGGTVSVGTGTTVGTVTVGQTQDMNRTPDTVTLSAYIANPGPGADTPVGNPLPIAFGDANALPKVRVTLTDMQGTPLDPQPKEMAEGDTHYVKVTALGGADGKTPTAPGEPLRVKLVASDAGDADARDIVPVGDIDILTAGSESTPVKLTIFDPDDDVGDEVLALDAHVSGVPGNTIGPGTEISSSVLTLTITDETDKKIWPLEEDEAYPKITEAIDAGEASELDDGKLNPEPQESFTVDASELFGRAQGYTATYAAVVDSTAVSVSQTGSMVTLTAEQQGTAKVTITGTAAMSSSFMPDQSTSNVASITFEVTVEDSELEVMVAADPTAIDEGGTSEITATANRMVTAADGEVAINLLVVGDAELDAESIMIAAGEMSGSAMLTAAEDEDTNDSTVTVVASGSGIADTVQVEIAVNDTTEAPEPTNAIEAKPEDEAYPVITGALGEGAMNPGDSATIDAGELFNVMEGYTASYAADVDGDAASASVSGSHVTVAADMAGTAKVTITGTATAAGSSFQAGQPAANVATVTFEVMVEDKVLTLMIDAPGAMEGNVVEGMDYDITVTANRAVHDDTEVTFMRSDMSEADVRDYSIEAVTIMAGEMMATATLMVTEDMTEDAGHAMGEALHLYAMAGDTKSNVLELTIWDEAVPALPLIAQLLLALFLMAGGARLYRRRQS